MRKGFTVEGINGAVMVFYPLTVSHLQELETEVAEMLGRGTENTFASARFNKLVKVYLASARRGDPNITEDAVRAFVDMENIGDVHRAVLGQKPLPKTDAPVIEAPRATGSDPTGPQTGGGSTLA